MQIDNIRDNRNLSLKTSCECFLVFDIPSLAKPFEERLKFLKSLIAKIRAENEFIELVDQEVDREREREADRGGETHKKRRGKDSYLVLVSDL